MAELAALAASVATLRLLPRPTGNEAEAAFRLAAPRGTDCVKDPDPPRAAPSVRCNPDCPRR